ncbi:MAG: BatA domain-containing protein, partial [Bacteroidaceae bacterium]|nr:BatA domain-containing protein [Bacteroidaceae bacterium]
MQFANPYFLLLLLLLIPYIIWYVLRHHSSEPTLQVSSTWAFRRAPKTYKQYLVHAPFLLR